MMNAKCANPMGESINPSGLGRIHWLLTIQSVVIILGSINRLSSLTVGFVAPNEFLRWVDLHNMLTLPLISLIVLFLLKQHLEASGENSKGLWHLLLTLAFVLGAFVLGVGRGNHEVTNYLHTRFCIDGPDSDLCRIIVFNDDEFSHWIWFTGFVMVNAAIMGVQALCPTQKTMTSRDIGLIATNALFVALGIFANLAFEEIGADLVIVALLAVVAWILLWRVGRQPLLLYYGTAYSVGLVATVVVKMYGS